MSTDIAKVDSALKSCELRLASLDGQITANKSRLDLLTTEVGVAKRRLEKHPKIEEFIKKLQEKVHERSLGSFERMLSAIVGDVIDPSLKIKLDYYIRAGAQALDLEVDKDGKRENILDGNGGALTNVVSAGLRYAALVRTSNRKFLVLDEPDCWLAPEKVSLFMQTLKEVSDTSGVQTFVISHHDHTLLPEDTAVVRLSRTKTGVKSTVVRKSKAPALFELKKLTLTNFMSHESTVISLFSGVTALVGENNLGKSAVVAAIRAIALGDSDDSMIMHDKEFFEITFEDGAGQRLVLKRNRKGSPKATYTFFDVDGTELNSGSPETKGTVPDFAQKFLNIREEEGLDIQVGNQKRPVFLLDEPASKRASILNVGKESSHLSTLVAAYKDRVKKDKDLVKKGEQEYSAILSKLASVEPSIGVAKALLSSLLLKKEVLDSTGSNLRQISALLAEIKKLVAISSAAVSELLPVPVLKDSEKLRLLLVKLSKQQAVASLKVPTELLPVPVLSDSEKLKVLLVKLVRHQTVSSLKLPPELLPVPAFQDEKPLVETLSKLRKLAAVATIKPVVVRDLPELESTVDLAKITVKLKELNAAMAAMKVSETTATQSLLGVEADITALVDAMGGLCPSCGHTISKDNICQH